MKTLSTIAACMLFIGAPFAFGAESTAPASTVKRTILSRSEVLNSGYEVVVVLVEVPANTRVGRHTHPGKVIGYVIEGNYTMALDGQPPRVLKPNETLEVPSGVTHDEYTGAQAARLIAVFTVERGKPLASPAP